MCKTCNDFVFFPTTRLVGNNVVRPSIRYVLSLQDSLTELNKKKKKCFVHKKAPNTIVTLEIAILSYVLCE